MGLKKRWNLALQLPTLGTIPWNNWGRGLLVMCPLLCPNPLQRSCPRYPLSKV